MSSGYEFPWEQAAMKGEELPDGLGAVDQMAYITLRAIYWQYKQQAVSREQAVKEKQKLRRIYQMAIDTVEFSEKMIRHSSRLFKETERAKSACRKTPTAENALALCDAIDGL